MAPAEAKTEGVKAFSDAKPKFSVKKPALFAAGACVAGVVTGSATVAGALLAGVFLNAFCDVVVQNILVPPFIDNRPKEELTKQAGKVCPYWPESSVRGPSAMGIEYEDIEFETDEGKKLRGWLMRSRCGHGNSILICMHGAGRDRRAWLR